MSDVEQRARDALNAVVAERDTSRTANLWDGKETRSEWMVLEAMCRQIEAHDATKAEFEAFKQYASDKSRLLISALSQKSADAADTARDYLGSLILPEPVVLTTNAMKDALNEALAGGARAHSLKSADDVIEALAKRGLTITKESAQ